MLSMRYPNASSVILWHRCSDPERVTPLALCTDSEEHQFVVAHGVEHQAAPQDVLAEVADVDGVGEFLQSSAEHQDAWRAASQKGRRTAEFRRLDEQRSGAFQILEQGRETGRGTRRIVVEEERLDAVEVVREVLGETERAGHAAYSSFALGAKRVRSSSRVSVRPARISSSPRCASNTLSKSACSASRA